MLHIIIQKHTYIERLQLTKKTVKITCNKIPRSTNDKLKTFVSVRLAA